MNGLAAVPAWYYGLAPWLRAILEASACGALLAGAVMLLQPLLRRRVPARWRFALWLLVMLRFVPIPLPESRISLYNWLPRGGESRQTADIAAPAPKAAIPAHKIAPSPPVPSLTAMPAVLNAPPPTAPTPLPPMTAKPSFPWIKIIESAYVLGAALLALRLLGATWRLRAIVGRARAIDDARVISVLEGVCRALQVRQCVPVMVSTEIDGPALVGAFRPRLLVPASLPGLLSADEWRMVFFHEMAHLRRYDVPLNYAFAALQVIHWFNPLLWLALPRIRAERELACDERVLMHTADPAPYGHTLLKLMEHVPPSRALAPAVGIVENRNSFARRIHMIAGFRRTPRWFTLPAVLALGIVAACTLTGPLTQAADSPPAVKPEKSTGSAGAKPRSAPGGESVTEPNEALERPIKDVNFDQMAFEKAVDWLRDVMGCNITVNWRALEGAGIDRNAPVSLRLKNVPARKVLRSILLEISGGGVPLDFMVDDNVLTVSTAENLASISQKGLFADDSPLTKVEREAQDLQKKLYDLRATNPNGLDAKDTEKDLAAAKALLRDLQRKEAGLPIVADAPARAPAVKKSDVQAMRTYDVHDILDVPPTQVGPLTTDQRNALGDLVNTVKATALDTEATISSFNGMVIVTASDPVQAKVQALLNDLTQRHREYRDAAADMAAKEAMRIREMDAEKARANAAGLK